jgi:hypothetical protein
MGPIHPILERALASAAVAAAAAFLLGFRGIWLPLAILALALAATGLLGALRASGGDPCRRLRLLLPLAWLDIGVVAVLAGAGVPYTPLRWAAGALLVPPAALALAVSLCRRRAGRPRGASSAL